MANDKFENTIMQSLQIACLTSIRDDGLLSDRQYEDLIERIGEKYSAEAEKKKEQEMKEAALQETEQKKASLKYYVDCKDCPIWEKNLLTMDEACIYFNLGSTKLRALTSDDDCEFVVWNGTRRLIKRERFAEFLDSQFSV